MVGRRLSFKKVNGKDWGLVWVEGSDRLTPSIVLSLELLKLGYSIRENLMVSNSIYSDSREFESSRFI